jgi:hypothetical protein
MFSPQKMGWPGWSPTSASERKEKDKSREKERDREANLSAAPELLALTPPPPPPPPPLSPVKGLVEMRSAQQQSLMTMVSSSPTAGSDKEPEIWRRFREAGALDESSIEKKDRAALMARITGLETEVRSSFPSFHLHFLTVVC